MKNVVIIASSMRRAGNSNALAKEFARGAEENGNNVEIIYLADKNIGFCKGCLACQTTQKCVIDDDAVEIAGKMKDADVIAFATPIYYYSICGQLKTMLDRANPIFTTDYKFRKVYLLATAAENEGYTVAGANSDIQGWVDCFENASFIGTVFAGGVTDIGDIKDHRALLEAYILGSSL